MSWDDQTKLMVCSKRAPGHCWDATLLDLIGYVKSRLRPEQRDILRNALTDPTGDGLAAQNAESEYRASLEEGT